MKSQPTLVLLFAILISFLVADHRVAEAALLGGWKPISDLKDKHVQEIAKFAVTEHNKVAKPGLTLEKVIRGETQVVAGTNYRLVIAAKAGKVNKNYQAVVWEKTWENFRNLTSFKQV